MSYYSNKEAGELRAKLFNKFKGKTNTDDKLANAFNVMNLGINSKKSDFGGNLLGDTLVFSSARSQAAGNIISKRTSQSFTNLYSTTIKSLIDIPEPKLFSKKITTKFNESTPSFSKNGKTMYFTQTEIDKKNKGKAVNKGSFKIYKSELVNGSWSTPVKIQIEADQFDGLIVSRRIRCTRHTEPDFVRNINSVCHEFCRNRGIQPILMVSPYCACE